jgi:uncharacterized membrane protein YoaK (UPF0700 family)
MACYLFTANVTGHATNLSQHVLNSHWLEMLLAFAALAMFFAGSFAASFLIHSFLHKGVYKAYALPFILEIILLLAIAFFGVYYNNMVDENPKLLAAALLFSMGLQNSTVTIVTRGIVKSSHVTGLVTDLGSEAAEWLHNARKKTAKLKSKLRLRFTILGSYIVGGLAGGVVFSEYEFAAFFCIAAVLLVLLVADLFMKKIKE